MSSRPDSEYNAGSRIGEGDWVWSKASRRRLKLMHRVANRRRDREVDLVSNGIPFIGSSGKDIEGGKEEHMRFDFRYLWCHFGNSDDDDGNVGI
jgi:hypothetical protein